MTSRTCGAVTPVRHPRKQVIDLFAESGLAGEVRDPVQGERRPDQAGVVRHRGSGRVGRPVDLPERAGGCREGRPTEIGVASRGSKLCQEPCYPEAPAVEVGAESNGRCREDGAAEPV